MDDAEKFHNKQYDPQNFLSTLFDLVCNYNSFINLLHHLLIQIR